MCVQRCKANEWGVRSLRLKYLCHISPISSNLPFFFLNIETSDHLPLFHLLCLVFNMKRNAGADNDAVYCTVPGYWSLIKQCDGGKRRKGEKKNKKISKEQFFCAGLFSLIWSAVKGGHYVTSSAHTWPTVWLPNTQGGSGSDGGGGSGVLWQRGGGRQTRGKR